MSEISASPYFSEFCSALRMSNSTIDKIRERCKTITKRINADFWSTESEFSHSFYVGSYGRGTSIYTSDIDLVVELPWTEFSKYDGYVTNGQSALLQAVRNSLQKTYPSSRISGDGQVVVVTFSDNITFEVVPAFKFSSDGTYYYPDTNYGGSWKKMDPKSEISSFNARNSITNKNLKKLCRMARSWNSNMNVFMSGVLIDTIAYRFLLDYEYSDKSFTFYDWMSRDFFKYLYENADKEYWVQFGSGSRIKKKYSFKAEAKKAYELSLEAIQAGSKGYSYTWTTKWREIYGNKFPNL